MTVAKRQVFNSSLSSTKFLLNNKKETKEGCVYPCNNHLSGMSWKASSGRVLRIVMGNMPISNSLMAMSIGLDKLWEGSTKMGAPIAIWRALAPTMRALSKRVSLGGPTQIFLSSGFILELSSTFWPHSRPSHSRRTPRWCWWAFHFSRCNYVVNFQNHCSCFSCRLNYLLFDR